MVFMASYWVGLIGALVGGAITAGSNLLIEWLRRRHEQDREGERDSRELRQAVRLVLSELEEIDYAIRQVVRSGVWGPPEKQLPAFAWADHRSIFAAQLDPDVWLSVASAYREENELNWHIRWRERLIPVRGWSLDNQEKARFREPWLAVRGAQQALGPSRALTAESARQSCRAPTGHGEGRQGIMAAVLNPRDCFSDAVEPQRRRPSARRSSADGAFSSSSIASSSTKLRTQDCPIRSPLLISCTVKPR